MLITDDCDISSNGFLIEYGGNGDYYLGIGVFNQQREYEYHWVKMCGAGGGGIANIRVKLAVAELYRALNEQGINHRHNNQQEEQK